MENKGPPSSGNMQEILLLHLLQNDILRILAVEVLHQAAQLRIIQTAGIHVDDTRCELGTISLRHHNHTFFFIKGDAILKDLFCPPSL